MAGVQCDYYDAGACRSCTLMGVSHARQLAGKQADVESALADVTPEARWLPAWHGPESGFRNKAKLVVGGGPGDITLGILDPHGHGVDLQRCGLYPAALSASFAPLKGELDRLQVPPYDVPGRRGELKHVIVTVNPDGDLMVRVVLRTDRHLERLRAALPRLRAALPRLVVLSVNLQPEHAAILEGPDEIILTELEHLTMTVGGIPLRLRPRSFFQTSTAAAEALYDTAARWAEGVSPTSVLDLYCGVGGFALSIGRALGPAVPVRGVEVSAEAVRSAAATASDLGLEQVTVETGDATLSLAGSPDLVVVNPPRRGITTLAEDLERSGARWAIYSSCRVESLRTDLARMPSWQVRQARLVDMFPQTRHHEVICLLERCG